MELRVWFIYALDEAFNGRIWRVESKRRIEVQLFFICEVWVQTRTIAEVKVEGVLLEK